MCIRDRPSLTEFEQRMEVIQQVYPYLVYEEEGNILGYAYAHRYKERAAYQWDVELSVYVNKDVHGKGIGSMLYKVLFILLKKQQVPVSYTHLRMAKLFIHWRSLKQRMNWIFLSAV